jgi:LacI family transcriptional regulator
MKVKLSDIAGKMGISVAAVSMAINRKAGVSEETRAQVMKVAEELGYVFKKTFVEETVKRNSQSKKFIKLLRISKHGLVVMETAFFSAVIDGIEQQCKKTGSELLISNIIFDPAMPNQIADEYHDEVDGLIVLCTELDDEDVVGLIELNCPKVILDRRFDANVDTVLMNNQKASRQAVSFFYSKGHREIGYLKSSKRIYNFDSRFRSYQVSIESKGLKVNEKFIVHLEPTIEGSYRDMLRYLEDKSLSELPTAFLADNDNIALGAMNAMKERGIRIPEDVSLIGIDDMPFCNLVSPRLSTVRIYKEEIGRQAVKMLVEQSANETDCSRKVEVDTLLVDRESVMDLNKN